MRYCSTCGPEKEHKCVVFLLRFCLLSSLFSPNGSLNVYRRNVLINTHMPGRFIFVLHFCFTVQLGLHNEGVFVRVSAIYCQAFMSTFKDLLKANNQKKIIEQDKVFFSVNTKIPLCTQTKNFSLSEYN